MRNYPKTGRTGLHRTNRFSNKKSKRQSLPFK